METQSLLLRFSLGSRGQNNDSCLLCKLVLPTREGTNKNMTENSRKETEQNAGKIELHSCRVLLSGINSVSISSISARNWIIL